MSNFFAPGATMATVNNQQQKRSGGKETYGGGQGKGQGTQTKSFNIAFTIALAVALTITIAMTGVHLFVDAAFLLN
jgi:hypothetical protein